MFVFTIANTCYQYHRTSNQEAIFIVTLSFQFPQILSSWYIFDGMWSRATLWIKLGKVFIAVTSVAWMALVTMVASNPCLDEKGLNFANQCMIIIMFWNSAVAAIEVGKVYGFEWMLNPTGSRIVLGLNLMMVFLLVVWLGILSVAVENRSILGHNVILTIISPFTLNGALAAGREARRVEETPNDPADIQNSALVVLISS